MSAWRLKPLERALPVSTFQAGCELTLPSSSWPNAKSHLQFCPFPASSHANIQRPFSSRWLTSSAPSRFLAKGVIPGPFHRDGPVLRTLPLTRKRLPELTHLSPVKSHSAQTNYLQLWTIRQALLQFRTHGLSSAPAISPTTWLFHL